MTTFPGVQPRNSDLCRHVWIMHAALGWLEAPELENDSYRGALAVRDAVVLATGSGGSLRARRSLKPTSAGSPLTVQIHTQESRTCRVLGHSRISSTVRHRSEEGFLACNQRRGGSAVGESGRTALSPDRASNATAIKAIRGALLGSVA
jgi:hypothetical protein